MVGAVVAAGGEGLEMYLDLIRAMKESVEAVHTADHEADVERKMKALWHDLRLIAFERGLYKGPVRAPRDRHVHVLHGRHGSA